MPLTPNTTILSGKYRILHQIGEGGMARVWLAEEVHFGRQVAIKEPHAGLGSTDSEELRQRFNREVKVSAALAADEAPNIVQALTAEPYEGELLLVMAYMPGGDLESLLAEHPDGLPIDRAVKITEDVLVALAAVHSNTLEIVHRDIKPSNIMFDAEGRARLGDFGLAQVAGWSQGREVLLADAHPGTPMYMAPEQESSSGYLTPAADIYALGCVLFEMLIGQKYKRKQRPDLRLRDIRNDIPDWLDDICTKALADAPWERWEQGGEMLAALQAGEQVKEPVATIPPAAATLPTGQSQERQAVEERDRAGKETAWWQRWPLWVGVVLALLAVIVVRQVLPGAGVNGTPTPPIVAGVGSQSDADIAPTPQDDGQAPLVVETDKMDTPTPDQAPTGTPLPRATDTPVPVQTDPQTPTAIPIPSHTPTLTATLVPTAPNPTVTPSPIPTATPIANSVVERFGRYTTDSMNGIYFINTAWGANSASIRPATYQNRPVMEIDYNVKTNPPEDYIVISRCFSPSQDWRGFSALKLWVANNQVAKTLVVQFGEGQPCGEEHLTGEVWRYFHYLPPHYAGELRIPFDSFHHADWSPNHNGMINYDDISYVAFGIQDAGATSGTIHIGNLLVTP